MRTATGILATTHVDEHGELFGLEALQEMVDGVNTGYLPVTVEHDPRHPPVGRVVSARLVQLEDGRWGVEGHMELFESGDELPFIEDGRRIPIPELEPGAFEVHPDRSFRNDDDQRVVDELAQLLSATQREAVKKSVDPLSALIIVGGVVVSGLAGGFLNKLGEDAAVAVKEKLRKLYSRRRGSSDQLLVFLFAVTLEDRVVAAQVILTNPTAEDIEAFLTRGQFELAAILPAHVRASALLRQLTYHYRDRQLHLGYGIRSDGVPVMLHKAS